MDDQNKSRHLANLKTIANVMDGKFGFGLDPIIGLIPGIGDTVTLGLAAYMIYAGQQLGVPKHKLQRMVLYTLLDGVVSLVPFFGDFADFFIRAHRRNWEVVRDHLNLASK